MSSLSCFSLNLVETLPRLPIAFLVKDYKNFDFYNLRLLLFIAFFYRYTQLKSSMTSESSQNFLKNMQLLKELNFGVDS